MDDLRDIEENYKRMTDEALKRLAMEPQELRLEVIPVLQQELLNRGQDQVAMSLTGFLVKKKEKPKFSDMSFAELKQLIDDRLASGEPIDSIMLHLKDDGVNIYDILYEDNKLREKAFDYITHLKEQGLEEKQIDEKLGETFSMDVQDREMIKSERKISGKRNLVFGYIFLVIGILLFILSAFGAGRVSVAGVACFMTGIWRIFKGYEQLKE